MEVLVIPQQDSNNKQICNYFQAMINLANVDRCQCGSLFLVIMDFKKGKPKAVCSNKFINKFVEGCSIMTYCCSRWGWIQERPKSKNGYIIIKNKSGGWVINVLPEPHL